MRRERERERERELGGEPVMTDLLRGDLHFALVLEEEFQDRLHHAWNVDLEFVPHPGHYLLYEENDGVLEVLVLGRPELLGDEGGAEREGEMEEKEWRERERWKRRNGEREGKRSRERERDGREGMEREREGGAERGKRRNGERGKRRNRERGKRRNGERGKRRNGERGSSRSRKRERWKRGREGRTFV